MVIQRLSFLILGCATFGLALCSPDAHAVAREDWPYDKLFKNANVIVIARPIAVREATAKERIIIGSGFDEVLRGVVTSFKILVVVKGEYKNEKCDIVHFRIKEGVSIANGPLLVSFHNKSRKDKPVETTDMKKKDYMLFLKKDKGGRLVFVSGQIDPILSVKELVKGSSD